MTQIHQRVIAALHTILLAIIFILSSVVDIFTYMYLYITNCFVDPMFVTNSGSFIEYIIMCFNIGHTTVALKGRGVNI